MAEPTRPMHLVFASTDRAYRAWQKSHHIDPSRSQRITSYEQLQGIHHFDPNKYVWHVLEGFRGAPLIMAARTRGMPLTADYEPTYLPGTEADLRPRYLDWE